MQSRKLIGSLTVIGLNLVIFYFLLRWCLENVRPDLLARQIVKMPLITIILTVAANIMAFAFYALRLGVLINKQFRISLPTVIVGFGLNSVLPFRLGELAKLYYADRIFSIPASGLFAAALVEKLCDLSALAILAVLIVMATDIGLIHKGMAILLVAIVLAGYVFAFTYRRFAHRIEQAVGGYVRLQALLVALREQSRMHHLRVIVLYTLAIWTLNTLVTYIAFSGFLPDLRIGIEDAVALLLISALAIAVPTAPAGVGVFEAGIVAYLTQVLGMPSEPALAAAVVFHLAVTIPQLAFLGGIMLWSRLQVADKEVRR